MLNYATVRQQTDEISSRLETEDHAVQPWPFVSPPKWHLGHTTWFFETFCLEPFFKIETFDPHFKYVFNSYYESQGDHISQDRRGILSRPSLERVREYRQKIDSRISEAEASLANLSIEDRHTWRANVELGLHHEQQHQELLCMDIKAILWHQPGKPALPSYKNQPEQNRMPAWLEFPEGIYQIGATNSGFSYDNEKPSHKIYLEEFQISDALVTNAEYLEFIEADGYSQPQHWLSDGWSWINQSQVRHPLYWRKKDGHWLEYNLSGETEIRASDPVSHISYYEADAFARWKKCRLPTEAEWEVAFHKENAQALWQWTASSYLPYPGFKAFDRGFAEYNGKFMVNQMIMRGGCNCTPNNHYRPSYRNFYPPEMRWQFSGIRLAR